MMTEAYMFAETASNSPIRMKTMVLFTNIEDLGRRIIRAFYGQRVGGWQYCEHLQDFVKTKPTFKVYHFELDTELPGKRISGSRIWEAMEREEGLRRDITKAMLRGGGRDQEVLKIV